MNTQLLPKMLLLIIFLFSMGCDKKNKDQSENLLSGATSKTWKINKQTDASGDKDKLTQEEKSEVMQFFADGKFTINTQTQSQRGTWTQDQAAKSLTLQFEGANNTETFQVVDLSENAAKLKAADGSEMILETE